MMDPREISAMAGQIMAPGQQQMAPQPIQAQAPRPEDLMAMLGSQGMPPGGAAPGIPPMDPSAPPPGGDQGPPTKRAALDLVPPGLKEEIAKYAAQQQVQMSKQLLALAGPESSDVPAGRNLLKDIWSQRKDGISDEQIAQWRAEGKKPAWILANSYPGRYAIMAMGHWRPTEKSKFAKQMKKLFADEGEAPSGQSYEPASLDTVAEEDPTPAIDL